MKRRRRHRWTRRAVVWRRASPRAPDPLARRDRRGPTWFSLIVASLIHGGVVWAATTAKPAPEFRAREPIVVEWNEAPEVSAPTVQPEPIAERPRRSKKLVRRKRNTPAPPSPVVGINATSTADGPKERLSFAVGTTRLGATARVAEAALVEAPAPLQQSARAVDSRLPTTRGAQVVRPRRLRRLRPDYPDVYRRRGIEGRVTVELTVDPAGQARDIRLVMASEHEAFNDIARRTAARERFSAATKNGAPVPYTLRFTYHFRLSG